MAEHTHKTYGILKFFRDVEKLDFLVNGGFYCNTPEFYRMSDGDGVSDNSESCFHSYRKERGDDPVKLLLNGKELSGVEKLTVHVGGIKDKYLHCWFAFTLPESEEDIEDLGRNLNRMRKEFGGNYAFVKGEDIETLANIIGKSTDFYIDHGNIGYSTDRQKWSAICKPDNYSYQQEYRFLIGDCEHSDIKPVVIQCTESISHLISCNQPLRIRDNETGHVWLELNENGCTTSQFNENS